RYNPSGSALVYATYLGGSGNDGARGVAADAQGRAYIVGDTGSTNFPLQDPIQPAFGGWQDVFATVLNPTGSAFVSSTFLGGTSLDQGSSVALYNNAAYFTGRTLSPNFPTVNPIQPSRNGGFDIFVAIISHQPPATPTPT